MDVEEEKGRSQAAGEVVGKVKKYDDDEGDTDKPETMRRKIDADSVLRGAIISGPEGGGGATRRFALLI